MEMVLLLCVNFVLCFIYELHSTIFFELVLVWESWKLGAVCSPVMLLFLGFSRIIGMGSTNWLVETIIAGFMIIYIHGPVGFRKMPIYTGALFYSYGSGLVEDICGVC